MSDDDDGLTSEQFRWLVVAAVGIGALLLAAILGLTAASYAWGANDPGDPVAAFNVDTIDRDDGVAANVTHAGGDAVNPNAIVIEVNGETRGTWAELGGEGPDIVAEGYELVVSDVSPGDQVTVLLIHGEDERTVRGTGTVGTASSASARAFVRSPGHPSNS